MPQMAKSSRLTNIPLDCNYWLQRLSRHCRLQCPSTESMPSRATPRYCRRPPPRGPQGTYCRRWGLVWQPLWSWTPPCHPSAATVTHRSVTQLRRQDRFHNNCSNFNSGRCCPWWPRTQWTRGRTSPPRRGGARPPAAAGPAPRSPATPAGRWRGRWWHDSNQILLESLTREHQYASLQKMITWVM